MKRKTLAVVLFGAIGLAASSYGQGSVYFNTYASPSYYPVTYSAQSQSLLGVGLGAGVNVSVELGYFIGAGDSSSSFTLLPSSIQPVGTSTAAINGSGPNVAGYIQGAIVSIPGYVSGPITFEVLSWVASGNGAGGGTYATSGYNGSYVWTETAGIASGQSPAGFFQNLTGNAVLNPTAPVPEPTTLALAGLGGLASLIAFRRKQA